MQNATTACVFIRKVYFGSGGAVFGEGLCMCLFVCVSVSLCVCESALLYNFADMGVSFCRGPPGFRFGFPFKPQKTDGSPIEGTLSQTK